MEHEFESAPRDNTRRTIVFRPIKISGLSVEATLRWLRNVLPEAHTRVHGSCCAALHRGRRRSRGDRPTVAVAASCDPPDVATDPAGGCPPVCQRSKQFAEQSAQHDAEQPDHNGNHLLASRFRNCADDSLVR